jgi:hypothetical protein
MTTSEVNAAALLALEERRGKLRKQYSLCLHKRLPKAKQVERELAACETAVALLRLGHNYGQCKCCLQSIDPERLELVPYTFYCFGCLRVLELTNNVPSYARAA